MKRILVPTDFSKTAGNALTFALEIARRTGASVHVAHFTRPYEGIENNIYNALLIDEYLDQKRRGLANWLKKYTRNGAFEEVVVTTGVDLGMAASSIVEAAQKGHFDLICMGTTGASGLLGMLLGSVAGGVIGSSRVPVLVVPKNGSFRKLATVGMATDFRADLNQRSLDMLRQLLLIERAEFHVGGRASAASPRSSTICTTRTSRPPSTTSPGASMRTCSVPSRTGTAWPTGCSLPAPAASSPSGRGCRCWCSMIDQNGCFRAVFVWAAAKLGHGAAALFFKQASF